MWQPLWLTYTIKPELTTINQQDKTELTLPSKMASVQAVQTSVKSMSATVLFGTTIHLDNHSYSTYVVLLPTDCEQILLCFSKNMRYFC